MKAKFNEEKNTLEVNGKKFNILSVKTELKGGDLKNGEWVNNKRYVTFEIEEMEEVKQPQRKFKNGDKVTLKSGCISKTDLEYLPFFDKYIRERLEVVSYTESGNVQCNNYFYFHEDWLEPWSDEKEELKDGDLAIFWDRNPYYALVRVFERKGDYCYIDECGTPWVNAIKFECKDQFEKVLRGEI